MTDEKKDVSEEIAELKAKVAALKDAVNKPAPAPIDWERRIAEHRDQMHQMRERRMSAASNFHPDDLRAMEAACPTSQIREIAMRDGRAPQGPSSAGAIPSSQQVSNVRPGGVNTSGWRDATPISNPPGTFWVDAVAIADEVRQRAELKRKLGE